MATPGEFRGNGRCLVYIICTGSVYSHKEEFRILEYSTCTTHFSGLKCCKACRVHENTGTCITSMHSCVDVVCLCKMYPCDVRIQEMVRTSNNRQGGNKQRYISFNNTPDIELYMPRRRFIFNLE